MVTSDLVHIINDYGLKRICWKPPSECYATTNTDKETERNTKPEEHLTRRSLDTQLQRASNHVLDNIHTTLKRGDSDSRSCNVIATPRSCRSNRAGQSLQCPVKEQRERGYKRVRVKRRDPIRSYLKHEELKVFPFREDKSQF